VRTLGWSADFSRGLQRPGCFEASAEFGGQKPPSVMGNSRKTGLVFIIDSGQKLLTVIENPVHVRVHRRLKP
jgi:hypothetical protein